MNALAGQGVQIDRQGGDQGLALTGLHLGDHAAVQHDAAHELHVEVPLAEGPLGRLSHGREALDQQLVERGTLRVALFEGGGARSDGLVGERLELRLEGIDLPDQAIQALDVAFVRGTEEFLGKCANHIDHHLGARAGFVAQVPEP